MLTAPGIEICKRAPDSASQEVRWGHDALLWQINNSTDQMIDCFEKSGISMDVVVIKDASKVAAAAMKGVR